MKSVVALSAALLAVTVVWTCLGQGGGGGPGSMCARLSVGQRVILGQSMAGGIDLQVLGEKQLKGYAGVDPRALPPKICEVYNDYIVIELPNGFQQAINSHAIDMITTWPAPAAAVVPAVQGAAPAVVPGAPVQQQGLVPNALPNANPNPNPNPNPAPAPAPALPPNP